MLEKFQQLKQLQLYKEYSNMHTNNFDCSILSKMN